MGESIENGVSSSADSGGNSSLLDFDIKNDFLNSWKPKSGGEANLMDIDFGSPIKKNKKPFGFDKMDMDFNLDSDFGKLSSFNIDMPDLDGSSPLKRDGKNKEKSKDASGTENKKGKADRFDFSFDFMEMDSFNFNSPVKKNKMNIAGEDKNDSPKRDHQGARIKLTEEKDGQEVGLSEKVTVSGDLSSLNTTIPHCIIDSDSIKEGVAHQSIIKENGPSENLASGNVAAASGDRDHDSTDVSMKSIGYDDGTSENPTAENVVTSLGVSKTSNSNTQHVGEDPKSTNENASLVSSGDDNRYTKLQELIMDKTQISTIQQTDGQTDMRISGGAIIQEVGSSNPLLEHSVHSTSGAESGEHTGLLQEEYILASNTVLSGEQDDSENVTYNSGSRNGQLVLEKSPPHISNSESQHAMEDHHVTVECLEQVQCNSDLKRPPMINMSSQMLLRGRISEDPIRNFPMPSASREKVDYAIPASEALITRSKYFTGSSKTADVLQKSTSSAPKPASFVSISLPNTKSSLTTEPMTAASISSQPISSCIAEQAEKSTSTTFASAKPLLPTPTITQEAERSTSSASAKPVLPTFTIAQQAGRSTSTPTSSKPLRPTSTIALQVERSTSNTSASAKPSVLTSTMPQQAERSTSTPTTSKLLRPTSNIALQVERSTSNTSASAKPSVLTSTMPQQAERSSLTSSANAKPSVPNLIPLMKNTTSESEKVASTKTFRKLTDLCGTENRRSLVPVDSSMNEKEDKSMGSMGSNKRLTGNMASKISPLAPPGQQTFESLKRKTPEAPDFVEALASHSKHYSDSSIKTRRRLETSGISIGKEADETLARHNAKGMIKNYHLSPVQILPELNTRNLGSPYLLKDDNYIEKAEACSKELEDICNMLRKKHEEAKDLLVRAIINNNRLLMLNHPLYDEKIRMIQKFAAGLTLGK